MKAKNCIEETGKVRRPATRKVRDDPGDVPGVNQILRQFTTWSTLDLEPSHGINHQKASEVRASWQISPTRSNYRWLTARHRSACLPV